MIKNATPFNPLDKRNLAESVVKALLTQEPKIFDPDNIKNLNGAGIYVIYYIGNYSLYRPISEANLGGEFSHPIYVGKAIPSGARRGQHALDSTSSDALSKRLKEHAESIQAAESTLNINDFFFRALTVEDIWIPLAENLLIKKFRPVWNSVLDGFGNHNPGRGRHQGMKPKWDLIHPGRSWANQLVERPEPISQITSEIMEYYSKI